MKKPYPKARRLSGAKNVNKTESPSSSPQVPRQRDLTNDLAQLRQRAFARVEQVAALLNRFSVSSSVINERSDAALLWNVYDWLLVPYSLWPLHVTGLAEHLLDLLESKAEPDEDVELLLAVLAEAPSSDAVEIMGAYEHDINGGRYEKLVKHLEKFDELERRMDSDAGLKQTWNTLTERFDLSNFRDKRGIIRRNFSRERNFRDHLNFKWESKEERFRILFDVFCHRWNLYGVEQEKPLLMKITVNPTPHGTMIFVPRYWSFDPSRDLKWREICRLHKAHGAARQGPKLSPSREDRCREAIAARAAAEEASKLGLRGEKRYEHILKKLNKDIRTDPSCVRRLLALAQRLVKGNGKLLD